MPEGPNGQLRKQSKVNVRTPIAVVVVAAVLVLVALTVVIEFAVLVAVVVVIMDRWSHTSSEAGVFYRHLLLAGLGPLPGLGARANWMGNCRVKALNPQR